MVKISVILISPKYPIFNESSSFVKGFPVLGCIQYFTNRTQFLIDAHKMHGDFFEFRVLHIRMFSICNPNEVEKFLATPENEISFAASIPVIMGIPIPGKYYIAFSERRVQLII